MRKTNLSYGELCRLSTNVGSHKNLPKDPEMGQICMYLNTFTGCTYTFVEYVGLLGWVFIADE